MICSESQRIWCTGIIDADAVALVFARDRDKPQGSGEIHFNLALSTGVSPVGPIFKGASVRVIKDEESKCSTWLTAKREGSADKLDGDSILQLLAESDIDVLNRDLYLGVTKRRKCSIGTERGKIVSSLAFHEVLGGDEHYLYVRGSGLKTGDTFQFFSPDPQIGLMSRNAVFDNLRALNEKNGDKNIVFGGLVFTCYGRGESFLGQPNIDGSAFLENFPGVPLSGVFCCGEIGRSSSSFAEQDSVVQRSTKCFNHIYSCVYLVIMYTPARSH
ncbi:F-box/LRR protein [Thalictrum thalictroides]|uniref:F-box/LRR protein n=1 Tax=Thalictrum thalictroides TaxID=46969 RepID=A0A7J6X9Z6_THATH|nr:F-box/LRR protein [Thalictrum thalictroides]